MAGDKPTNPHWWFSDAMKLIGIREVHPLSTEISAAILAELQKKPEIVAEAKKLLSEHGLMKDLMERIRLHCKQEKLPVHIGHIPDLALAFIDRVRDQQQHQD